MFLSLFFFLKKSKIKHGFGEMLTLFFLEYFDEKFSTKLEILQITHILLNFKLVLYKNANFDRALIWMKVLECLAFWWGVEKEKFLLIPIGESLCILQWRGKDIFLIWFHGFFLNILLSCMQRSRLLFAGRKAHVGGHPGHNFSLPRVKKIETWSLKTPLPQILSSDPPICMYVVSSSSSSSSVVY